jgi:hypothetical protein
MDYHYLTKQLLQLLQLNITDAMNRASVFLLEISMKLKVIDYNNQLE